eukprot:3613838-Rhodomonas_salina.4
MHDMHSSRCSHTGTGMGMAYSTSRYSSRLYRIASRSQALTAYCAVCVTVRFASDRGVPHPVRMKSATMAGSPFSVGSVGTAMSPWLGSTSRLPFVLAQRASRVSTQRTALPTERLGAATCTPGETV